MTDQKLMDYFKFDEADLQANRSGQFTEAQKKYLSTESKYDKGANLIAGIFLLLVALAGLAFGVATVITNPNVATRLQFGLTCGCGLPLIFVVLSLRPFSRAFAKFQVQLQKAEGPISIVKAERTSTSTRSDGTSSTSHYFVYELHVDTASFDVTPELADIMMQGDVYALYYSQGSERVILSVELVSKA